MHQQRIDVALQLNEKEPLQGAFADFFFAFQKDLPIITLDWLAQAKNHLQSYVYHHFQNEYQTWQEKTNTSNTVAEKSYFSSSFATRWSVLVSPSMAVAKHQLRSSRDGAKFLATQLVDNLIEARLQQQDALIIELQYEFFQHCLVCNDRMAFLQAWLKLSQQDWQFDAYWNACSTRLNQQKDIHFNDFIQLSSKLKGAE
ncbi:hypothetical protein [Acinetobacter sp. c3-l95]|uniref:hypothetical protein n=1 Tax=Acinetobacter sp. c3-l95 TaxID=3342804 RepID=UPI0035BA76B8